MGKTFTFFMCTCLLLLSTTGTSQDAAITFVQSFRMGEEATVIFDAPGSADVEPWDQSHVRVQMEVRLENGSHSQLRAMTLQGRYRLQAECAGDTLLLRAPLLRNRVRVNGLEMKEHLHYFINVPHGVLVIKEGEGFLEFHPM